MAEYFEFDWKCRMISHEMHIGEVKEVRHRSADKTQCIQEMRALFRDASIFQEPTHLPESSASSIPDSAIPHESTRVFTLDDDTIIKFLYARKFVVSEAFTLAQNYWCYRQKHAQLFDAFSVQADDIRAALENVLPGVLGSRDRKGRAVLLLSASNWDCTYGLVSVYRALLFALELLVRDVQNQANGFVIVVDWTEFSLRQTANLKPSVLKLMIEGLQDCFPARFKGIHFLGQPWYVEAALAVIKPFLKEKIKARIYMHGNNLSTLHDYLPKDMLPAELGGDLATFNPGIWIKSIEKQDTL